MFLRPSLQVCLPSFNSNFLRWLVGRWPRSSLGGIWPLWALMPASFGGVHTVNPYGPQEARPLPGTCGRFYPRENELWGRRWGRVTPASLRGSLVLAPREDPSGLATAWSSGRRQGKKGVGWGALHRWSLGLWAAPPTLLSQIVVCRITGMDLQPHPHPGAGGAGSCWGIESSLLTSHSGFINCLYWSLLIGNNQRAEVSFNHPPLRALRL